MILKCRLSTRTVKEVEVSPSDPLFILLKKLEINDKDTKFTYNRKTHSMASIQTFKEIDLTIGGDFVVFNQAISGI